MNFLSHLNMVKAIVKLFPVSHGMATKSILFSALLFGQGLLAQETEVTLAGGILSITDINGGASNDNLNISFSTGTYTISDGGGLIITTSIPGATGSGTASVTVPNTGVNGINIQTLGGNDFIVIQSMDALAGDFTINGGTGNDHINIAGANIALTGNGNDVLMEAEQIFMSGTNPAISVTGTGQINIKANEGASSYSQAKISFVDFALSAEDGNINLLGISYGSFSGDEAVYLIGATSEIVTTGAGNISISGEAPGLTYVVTAIAVDGASIRVEGTGNITFDGNSARSTGVRFDADSGGNADLSAVNGDITITGDGAGFGIWLKDNAVIETTGSGDIIINGNGLQVNSLGIQFGLTNPLIRATGSGNIQITGNAGFADIRFAGGTIGSNAGSGNITFIANDYDLAYASSVIQGDGNLFFEPLTSGVTIGLGAATGTPSISNNIISQIQAGFNSITIGDGVKTSVVNAGGANFSSAGTTVILRGTTIRDLNNAGTDITSTSVTGNGNLAPGASPGIFAVSGNYSFANGSTFTAEINDAGTAGTDYDQLDASGSVTIGTNVTLTLVIAPGYTPSVGDQIMIVKTGSGITGTFNGFPEGSTVAIIGGLNFTITYTGGDGNDVVILAPPAGAALDFEGINDRVDLPFLFDPAATSFTVSAWVKPTLVNGNAHIFIQQNDGTGTGRTFLAIGSADKFYSFLGGSALSGTTAVVANTWYHVVVTYDGVTLRLYINGVLEASEARTMDASDGTIILGAGKSGNFPFQGAIDEVRFWTRALCKEEILHTTHCELPGMQTDLEAYYTFNQGFAGVANPSETTLQDFTNLHDGTLVNFALNGTTSNWIAPGAVLSGLSCTPFTIANYDSNTCTCQLGYYATLDGNGNITACTICPLGYYCPDGINSFPCAAGYFQDLTGQTSCTACPPGKFQPNIGSAVCLNCLEGTYNPFLAAVLCQNCPIGTFSASTGQVACETCEPGYFANNPGSNQCSNCGPPSFSACPTVAPVNNTPGQCSASVSIASPTVSAACTRNHALDFDGVNDYVSFPSGITAGLNQFTFEAWVYWKGSAGSSWQRIMDFGNNTSVYMFLTPRSADNNLRFAITTSAGPGEQRLDAPGPLQLNEWVHLAVVLDKNTSTGRMYLNGVEVAVNTNMTLSPADLGVLANNWLGRSQYPDPFFNGQMDEVRIWNSARTQAQIQVSKDLEINATVNGLLAFYNFNEGISCCSNAGLTTLADGMGVNHGTLNSFSLSSGCVSNWVAGAPALGNPLTLSNDETNNCGDPSGVFNVGVHTITWTATGANGETATCAQTFTVNDSQAPVATCQNVTVSLDANGNGSTTAAAVNNGSSDNCGVASLSLSQTAFNCTHLGNVSVTLAVSDASNNSSTCTATVTVIDAIAPTAICQDVTVSLDANGNGSTTAAAVNNSSSDNCGVASLSLSQTAFNCTHLGNVSVTLAVSDASNNSSTCTATVTVIDAIAPTAICQDVTVSLDANGNGSTTAAAVNNGSSDNCGVASLSLSQTAFNCTHLGNVSVTLAVSDASSNPSSCTATVTVIDAIAPTAICQDVTVSLDANGNGNTTAAAVNNGSSDNCGVASLSLSQTAFNCTHLGNVSVTLAVSDASNNSSTCTATVTVIDAIAPTAICQDVTVSLDANGNGSTTAAAVNNGSSDNCGVASLSLSQTAFTCTHLGTNSVTLTVSDASNNTTTCTATVTVVDAIAPTAICQDVTVSLDANGNGSTTAAAVNNGSSDNCGVASLSLSQTAFTCTHLGTNSVTLTVSDASNNTTTCTATVTVIDAIAPTAICQDVTVSLDANGNGSTTAAAVNNGSSDNCGVASLSLSQTAFTCTHLGTNSVTLTVSDASNNTTTCTATVTVVDAIAPTAICQDVTVSLDANGNGSTTAAAVNNGSSDNCGVASLSLSQTAFTCTHLGTNSVTLTVSDASNNTSTCTATVTVVDAIAPTAICQDVTVSLDANGNGSTTAAAVNNGSSDNCGVASLSLSQTAFTCTHLGTNSVTLTVSDASNNTTTCTATVTVVDAIAPTAICQDVTVSLDANGNGSTTAAAVNNGSSDNCGVASLSLSQTAFTCTHLGTNSVTLTVSDASNNTSSCTATVTVVDAIAPTAICQDVTVSLDANGNGSTTAAAVNNGSSDNCGVASLSLSQTAFTCTHLGTNSVTLTVSDASNNTTTCTATVTVVDAIAPTAICQDVTVSLDANGNGSTTAAAVNNGSSDNCGVASLSLSQTAFTCTHLGTNSVTLTVSDASNNTSTCTATVTVVDAIAPTAICQDVTVSLDANGNGSTTAAAVNNGSSDNCGVASLSLSQTAFTCTHLGTNSVTLTVSDASNNTTTCTATVTVVDAIAPTAICQDVTVSLDANGNGSTTAAAVNNGSSDNCGVASLSLSQTAFTCTHLGTNSVTLTVSDASNNTSTCTATVTVVDAIAPTAICQDVTVSLDANGNGSTTAAAVNNGSSDNCGVASLSLSQTAFTCTHLGTNSVTLTVSDASNNTTTCTATVTVVDAIAPTAICQDVTVSLDANGNGSTTAAAVNNGSSDNCGVASLSLSQTAFTCAHLGNVSVTLAVSDVSNNASSCTATVTVMDMIPPTITCPADQTVAADGDCEGTVGSWSAIEVTDNCTVNSSWTVVQSPVSSTGLSGHNDSEIITLSATDDSGNTGSCTFTVTLKDVTPPSITCPINLTVAANGDCEAALPNFTAMAATSDNCAITLNVSQTPLSGSGTILSGHNSTQSITLTADDGHGNTSSCSTTVTLIDITPPTALCRDVTLTLDADGEGSTTISAINDGSFDNCGISSLTISETEFTCADIPSRFVLLTVTDVNNNTSVCTSTVTVKDDTAPTAVCQDITVELDNEGQTTIGTFEYVLGNASGEMIKQNSGTPGPNTTCDCPPGYVAVGYEGYAGCILDNFRLICKELLADGSLGNTAVTTCWAGPNIPNPANITQHILSGNDVLVGFEVSDVNFQFQAGRTHLSLEGFGKSTEDVGNGEDNAVDNVAMTGLISAGCYTSDPQTTTAYAPAGHAIVGMSFNNQVGYSSVVRFRYAPLHYSLNNNPIDNGSEDECGGPLSFSLNQNEFTCSDIPSTVVILTVTDEGGNTAICTATVTVEDNVLPAITCPGPQTVNLSSECKLVTPNIVVITDAEDACGILSVVQSPIHNVAAPSMHLGTQVVTVTATDNNNNSNTCTVLVTAIDVSDPVITVCPEDRNVTLDENCAITVPDLLGDAEATDNCTYSLSQMATDGTVLASEHNMTHTVTITATDAAGNTATCEVVLTALDETAPVINACAPAQDVALNEDCEIAVPDLTTLTTASDNCTYTLSQASTAGSMLGLAHNGTTTVIITATDDAGLTATCAVVLTAKDETDPAIDVCASAQDVNLDGNCEISIPNLTGGVTASDNCPAALNISQSPTAGTKVALAHNGTTSVTITVTDVAGNSTDCTVTLTAKDMTAPSITCPDDVTVEMNSPSTLIVPDFTEDATATDNCSENMTITQSPTGGTQIAAVHNGTYEVTLTVSDEAGNSAQCAVTITAEYIPVLMVTCPDDITVSAGECNCSQTVSFEPIVEAEGPYQILYSHNPGSSFPIGTTTVTITVIDGATEESTSCTFSITVLENERMQVSGNNQVIANGAMTPSAGNHTKMGSVALNGTITRTFTIRNTGCSNLMLDGTPLVEIGGANPSFFSVIAQPGSSNLGSCATTTFQIRYTGSAMGLHSATVTISNNAPGQDPYTFAISAATSAKLMQVRGNSIAIPDGDVTPASNDWTDFGLVNLNSNRTRSFYIHNLGSTTLNLTGTPRVAISGPGADKFTVTLQPASTVLPGSNRQFSIRFNALAIGDFTATVSIANDDLGADPYTFTIRGVVLPPNMSVTGNNIVIQNGDNTPQTADNTDFGTRNVGTTTTLSYYVRNASGAGVLLLNGTPRVAISGAGASAFNVATTPVASLTGGGSSLMRISFSPTTPGVYEALVTIANNDPTKNPYTFAIRGATPGAALPYGGEPWVIDRFATEELKLSAYPNPVNEQLFIEAPASKDTYRLEIMNLEGRVVYSAETLGGRVELQAGSWMPGMYIIRAHGIEVAPIRFIKIE
jgi:hypothetical protein